MLIEKIQALRGPNLWTTVTALEAWIDVSRLPIAVSPSEAPDGAAGAGTAANGAAAVASTASQALVGRLCAWLPGVARRLDGAPHAPLLLLALKAAALELQCECGLAVEFGAVRATKSPTRFRVVVQYHDEMVGKACLEAAREICMAAWNNVPCDVAATITRLRELAYDVCLGPSTSAIVEAARRRGIPMRRLNANSLVQLGQGSKQRRICAAEIDSTSAIAEAIAQDKDLTRLMLQAVGVPVPGGRPVLDADDAWAAAEEIGVPVVVKPQHGNQGRGVATNLTSREQVQQAFAAARDEGSEVIVEKFASGDDYRVLVVGGKLVAAARREPAHVIGNGSSTIRQLVAAVNQDPRRSDGHATSLSHIKFDAVSLAVLHDQGYTTECVPASGVKALIRRNANLSTGGTAVDVTDTVHPEVAARCVEAANVVGLHIAGLDVVCSDIGRPLEEQGGVIVEINAAPGLRMHLDPTLGKPRPVGEAIVSLLYPDGENGRIPTVLVTGANGKTTSTRLVSHILTQSGKRVGYTCTDGIFICGRRIDADDCSGPLSAANVLLNPQVDAAVLETARGGILRAGLGVGQCDVAVVTNIAEGDHLGLGEIDTPEQLAEVKRVIVTAVAPHGSAVLNADDPLVAAMAPYCPGHVVYFSRDARHPLLTARRKAGGRVAFTRDNSIVLADGEQEFALLSFDRVPLTYNGRIGFQVENVLASAAATWALGVPCEIIRNGLESFLPNLEKSPGRFNLVEVEGATVIFDYGHNPSSLKALLDSLAMMPHQRRLAVYSAAGDRRDEDLVRQGELLGGAFDSVVLYEDHYLRGRQKGEIMARFQEGVARGRRCTKATEITGWKAACEMALKGVRPGDLLLVQADQVDETVEYVKNYLAANGLCREIGLNEALSLPTAVKTPLPS